MPTDEEWAGLVAKLDSLIESIKPKTDTETAPPDARDKSLSKGISFFKTYLAKTLPKEKLDTLEFDELVLAAEMKSVITPAVNLNPAPPIKKTDSKTDQPDFLRATVSGGGE